MFLGGGKRKLCSFASNAVFRRWRRSSSHLSPNPPAGSPISRFRSTNSNWARIKIGARWRGLDGGRVGGASPYCSAASRGRCWSCGSDSPSSASQPFLVCGSCKAVQPVDPSVDYFQIFGIERRFNIEEENLESKYKEWQKKLHPDLVHTKSEREKGYAAEQSARVIDAYHTLTKSLARASYLLELEGVQVDEEATLLDPELLTEVMEIREAVEEARDTKALEKIRAEIRGKLNTCLEIFVKEFAKRNFNDAVDIIKRMTYYEKALQEVMIKI